ncbi:SDR family NAD(P)-dependent oxidoreductase [Sorangium cellulosum]|uniref:3-hydroxyacyl-CoA dehydrogenase n=1 Tax=Sorangium cellulosum TaxID=56 RepID=A0A150QRS2_SORCE|nr:SDR family oxidoreductase [Sorangium cellulosum]KYF70654.1 3-hydroxyacyl-CoA dehydrogenase [Sorangium cellulosum]
MSLEGKLALVTGGGRGVGRAIAERLARDGARVAVAGRTQAEIDETAAAVGGVAVRLDVGDREGALAALAALEGQIGPIDVLVNNAGAAESAPFDRTTDAMWDRMFAVNATGPFVLCRALVPKMIARGFGRVVNVASTAGLIGFAYSIAYCASKHAMIGMTRTIALEIARTPVTINCVCPGWVNTRMADEAIARIAEKTGRGEDAARRSLEAMSPQGRMVEPEEVALVVSMLCSDEARSIHGQAISVDGGAVMR